MPNTKIHSVRLAQSNIASLLMSRKLRLNGELGLGQKRESESRAEQMRYMTNEQGERVGVLLDLETYDRLTHLSGLDTECLIDLNQSELQALAESMLAPAAQSRLDALLARNAETDLCANEQAELDRLLDQIDNLTILKTRARYTLQSLEIPAQAS
jgi:hypothetical protein